MNILGDKEIIKDKFTYKCSKNIWRYEDMTRGRYEEIRISRVEGIS